MAPERPAPNPGAPSQASTALTGGDVSEGPECGCNAGARGITGSSKGAEGADCREEVR